MALVVMGHWQCPNLWADSAKLSTTEVVELLISDRPEDRARGEDELKTRRSDLIDGLLKTIRQMDLKTMGKSAYELELIISPWMRGKENGARFYEYTTFACPWRPVERAPGLGEAKEVREVLQASIATLLEKSRAQAGESGYDTEKTLAVCCEALGEVADDQTMDWTLEQLSKTKEPRLAIPLLNLAQSYLGIGPAFLGGGLCGLSSEEERAAFRKNERQRVADMYASLDQAWQQLRPLDQAERIAYAVKHWRDHFVTRQKMSSGQYFHSGWLFQDMESLIRLGTPAVETIRAQQTLETTTEAKGVWEAVIATITGHEDARLVRELLDHNPDNGHKKLACEIILSAKSTQWMSVLEELQHREYFNGDIATAVIARCHGMEGIPAIRNGSRDIDSANGIISELEKRAQKGTPPWMRRYQFQ